jgi:hypothetical protein
MRFLKEHREGKTVEIIVLARRSLPEVERKVPVKGRIYEAFPIGDQKLLVPISESIETGAAEMMQL